MIELQPDLELTTGQAEALLGAWLGAPLTCSAIRPLKGGMVNTVLRLEFDRPPHSAVVKLHGSNGARFAEEAASLRFLRAETALPVPEVYLHDASAGLVPYAFLLMERLPGVCLQGLQLGAADRADLEVQLAEALAELHSHTGTRWGGIDTDNGWEGWAELFGVRLAEARAYPVLADRLAPEVLAQVDRAIDLAGAALQHAGEPTLIHGDVWDGNMMVHQKDGRWVLSGLLDPDLQYVDVEMELAYLEVFDVPRDTFLAAYTAVHPLRPGYEERRLFYWLRTALIHVALFGDEFFCRYTARIADTICR